MKRILAICCLLLTSVILLVAIFGFWCLGTTAGTRWLAETAGKLAEVEITAKQLEGSLLDGLIFTDLHLAWQSGDVLVDALELDIQLSSLWSGSWVIEKLEMEHLTLKTAGSEESEASPGPETSTPPADLAAGPEWLDLTINRLRITDFTKQSTTDSNAKTMIATLIAGQYRLANHKLSAADFSYHSPYVELDGDFEWDLRKPHLVMAADVHLPEASADPDLFKRIKVPVSFPAHLELEGDWNAYSGPVRFGTFDQNNKQVWLTAKAAGSLQGIRFEALEGHYLGGDLTGELELAWLDSFWIKGDLAARAIDPGAFIEGTTGKASFDVTGGFRSASGDQPLRANVDAFLHDARFRGHELQGRAAGQWLGTELVNLDIDLSGDGAHLLAKGIPSEKVAVDLEVRDLAAFSADLGGHAVAAGWLRWKDETLSGGFNGQGENINWQGTKVRTVEFRAQRPIDKDRFEIEITGEDWERDALHLQKLAGKLSGTPADHQLTIAVESSLGDFNANAGGSYQASSWAGRLSQLAAQETPWGSWVMTEPTSLQWANDALTLETLHLQGDRGTRLEAEVKEWGSPDRSSLTLDWTGVELDWLQPYAAQVKLSGRSDGLVEYTMSGGQPASITGYLTAHGHIEDEHVELEYEALELNFDWDNKGLKLTGSTRSAKEERIHVRATSTDPLRWSWPLNDLEGSMRWQELNLSRFDTFLDDGNVEGLAQGEFSFSFDDRQLAKMSGTLNARGRVMQGNKELGPRTLQADLTWDDERFHSEVKVTGASAGYASLQLTSKQAPALLWPQEGEIALDIKGINLAILEPALPTDIEITGSFDAHAEGLWKDKNSIDLSGTMALIDSRLDWISEEGQIKFPLRDAAAEWQWQGEKLTGSLTVNLADQGGLQGGWQLPLPARIPTAFKQNEPLQVTLNSRMQAIGILSAIGPWLVQDVSGETEANLSLQGSLANPDLRGEIKITDGGAYLPKAGIELEGINLRAEWTKDRLSIADLELHSGPGSISGRGEVVFDHWNLDNYQLHIIGEDFQVVDFPELQVLFDPDLTLSGTSEALSLQGSVMIPVLTIKGSQTAPEIVPSKDVVIAKADKQREELRFATDIHVVVELGENVTVNSGGLNTHLSGGAIVTTGTTGEVFAQGEVELVTGSYRAYGVKLQIRQGVLNYKGGPITNPDLRVFAAREVGDVLAGVQITGSAEAPVVTLYSKPTMPERDILGYILMGRAVSSDSLDTDMLTMGAGTLLPGGYGEAFSQLGLTEVDIQGLFAGLGGVKLRRQFAEKWELESTLGIESGVDIYYIFEFE